MSEHVSINSMHTISDGHASIVNVPVKVKTSLHQAFSQVVDVMNLCFMQALLYRKGCMKQRFMTSTTCENAWCKLCRLCCI